MIHTTRKYIIIPNYAPLYAMRKCFGPTQAPLTKPTLTPIDIIGELLKQSGREKLTIYEVVRKGSGFSEPVLLTPLNYKMPYQDIVSGQDKPTTPVVVNTPTPVTIGESVVHVTTESTDLTNAEPDDKPIGEDTPVVESVTTDSDTETDPLEVHPAEEISVTTDEKPATSNPYQGMTKAERRAARRKEMEAQQNQAE